jgi:hypothetical protein
MEGIEDAFYDDGFFFCNGLDLMEGVEDAFPDGDLCSCNGLSDSGTSLATAMTEKMVMRPNGHRARNDVSKDCHSVSEPEAPDIGEQMAPPGAGNYNSGNHDSKNINNKLELKAVKHEAPTVECIKVTHGDKVIRSGKVELEAPE